MIRRTLWFVFSLFPILSFATFYVAFYLARLPTPSDWPVWGALISAGVPVAVVEGIEFNLYWAFLWLVGAHYGFFILHPFFNRVVSTWLGKLAWSVSTLLFYPIVPPIYAMFCTGSVRTQPKAEPRRAPAYSVRRSR